MQIIEDTQQQILSVSGALHVSEAGELRDALSTWLRNEQALKLDLSAVQACDAASLQLLCALRKSAGLANKPFSLVAASAAVAECDSALGLGLCSQIRSEAIGPQAQGVVGVRGGTDGN